MMRSTLLLSLTLIVVFATACAPDPAARGRMMTRPLPSGVGPSGADSAIQVESYESTPPAGLPEAKPVQVVRLQNGSNFTLRAEKVRKEIAGRALTMYGYNGMVPGPLLVVDRGAAVGIAFTNNLDKPTTVHWHGLRGDYRSDGVPGLGQDVILPGATYTYNLTFPDAGVFWYHPHVREDVQQDLGLAGMVFVQSFDAVAGSADAEQFLMLDDIVLTASGVAPYGQTSASHAIMGRYGNVLLVNGEPSYNATLQTGHVLRLYLTNAANARPFRVSIPGAQIKLVAGDAGAYEQQEMVTAVTLGPGERSVIDVLFAEPGMYYLRADNPLAQHLLGSFSVSQGVPTEAARGFADLRTNEELKADVARFARTIAGPPQRSFELDFSLPGMGMGRGSMMMHETGDGIEWEDTMPMMGDVTSDRVTWEIRDSATRLINKQITLHARVGDVEKWHIANRGDSMHPMQHPIHLHGQRFIIVAVDGRPVENHVWKDVVLIAAGHSVDLLVEYTRPGEWMLHCHIAEHLETGMFAYVSVADADGKTLPRFGEAMH